MGLYRDVFHASYGLGYDNGGLLKLLALDLRQRYYMHPALSLRLAHHLRKRMHISQPIMTLTCHTQCCVRERGT